MIRDEDEALALLASCGARPDRWPAADRAAMEDWIVRSPLVRAAAGQARLVDQELDGWPAPVSTPAMQAAVVAAARRLPAPSRQGGWPQRAAAMAAAVALLIGVGLAGRSLIVPAGEPDAAAMTQLAETDPVPLVFTAAVAVDEEDWRL